MSLRAIQLVKAGTRATTAARFVLWVLAEHAGDDLRSWPSTARLARVTGLSERSVRRALQELELAREISITHVPGRVSVYLIALTTPDTVTGVRGLTPDRVTGVRGLTPDTVTGVEPANPGHSDRGAGPDPGQGDRGPRTQCPGTPDTVSGEPSKNRHRTPTTTTTEGAPNRRPLGGGGGDGSRLVDPEAAKLLAAFGVTMRPEGLIAGMSDHEVECLLVYARANKLGQGAVVRMLQNRSEFDVHKAIDLGEELLDRQLAAAEKTRKKPARRAAPPVDAPPVDVPPAGLDLEAERARRLEDETAAIANACECRKPVLAGNGVCGACGGSLAGRFAKRRRSRSAVVVADEVPAAV